MKLTWKENSEFDGLHECFNEEGTMIAFITTRPQYCDRGHFVGHIEIGGLDRQDAWPNYYMRLDRAKGEISDFLKWRLEKIRCKQTNEDSK